MTAFAVVEVLGGLATSSLALLADAGHMASDGASLGLALFAIWLGRRPATPTRSFGFRRAEILAAFVNALALVAIAVWIAVEAYRRLGDPPDVLAGWVIVVALGGLAVNLAGAAVLHRSGRATLNVEAAFRHVLADLLGSLGVLVAALVVLTTGWTQADPVVSVLIAALILASAWGVLRDSTHVLLEGAPAGMDTAAIERAILEVPGVASVHDLHVWSIASDFPALAAHVLVHAEEDCHARRRDVERALAASYGIRHTTLQVEHARPELIRLARRR